jgi:hypothetical protein
MISVSLHDAARFPLALTGDDFVQAAGHSRACEDGEGSLTVRWITLRPCVVINLPVKIS